jgi:hypothetical protein
VEVDQLAFGFGEVCLDGLDCPFRLLGGTRGDVDFCIVGVEDLGEFLANTTGGASDDEDLRWSAPASASTSIGGLLA